MKEKFICEMCNKQFYRTPKPQNTNRYCSRQCSAKAIGLSNGEPRKMVECGNCNIVINKLACELKNSKSGKTFCSRSCSAIYNNKNKKHGTRRSKLEKWVENELNKLYPELKILYNQKDTIKSELDIYIPSLKLAFELNGIFHYEAIYGKDKLEQIQNKDNRKFQFCLEQGIELCIIDTSRQTYVTSKTSQQTMFVSSYCRIRLFLFYENLFFINFTDCCKLFFPIPFISYKAIKFRKC